MCFFRSGYKPTAVPRKSTFRYNYVQFHSGVVLFLLILELGLRSVIGLGFGFGIGNLKHIS